MKTLQGPIQEALVTLLCYDDVNGATAASLLSPTDFDPVFRSVVELVYEYRSKHKRAPGEHTSDLFDTLKDRDEDLATAMDQLLASIEATKSKLNPDFVLERAAEFVRYQRLKSGIRKALTELQRDTADGLLAAEATLTKTLRATTPALPKGIDVFDDAEGTLRFLDTYQEAFATGIKELDALNLGPSRKRLHWLQAPYGAGKSWWFIQLAHEAKKRGQNVLYVSLEMSVEDVCQRMVQRALAVPRRKVAQVKWQRFITSDDPRENGVRTKTIEMPVEYTLADEREVRRGIRDLAGQGRCKVFEFPTGRLSPTDLENHMTLLAERQNFRPDLVIVDYPGIMRKPDSMESWDGIVRIVEELRAIAQSWNVGMATVGQVTTEGLRAKTSGKDHAAGARAVIGVIDNGISYNQTDAEKELGLARLKQLKARQEADGFTVLISQSYDTGRFCVDSCAMGAQYMESLK